MSQTKNFDEFYKSQLAELLQPLEIQRKTVARFAIAGISMIVFSFIFFLIAGAGKAQAAVIVAFISFLIAVVFFIIYFSKNKKYRESFKRTVIARIIEFIDPDLNYTPEGYINKEDYHNSGLYIDRIDRYHGDDYVEGTREKTFFSFSELHTQKKVSSGKNTHWVTIFKGLFFIGDFNKHFHGRTYVYSEHNPQIGFFAKMFSTFAANLEKVKLESLEFEKKFIVYSNDQVEARYILTPSFMERLLKLQELMGDKTSYSFVDTRIYVAVPIRDGLFEPALFSKNDYNKLGDYYNTVHIVFDIIDELNLNLRIWSKD